MSDCFDHEADAWDSLIADEDNRSYSVRPKPTQCKYCKATFVTWGKQDGKWRLFNKFPYTLHTCDAYFVAHDSTNQ